MPNNSAPAPLPHVPGAVLQVKTGGYMVASRSISGAWWLVYGNSCTCPATVRCFHLRQVAAYCKAQDAKYRRPAAKVNASLMVD